MNTTQTLTADQSFRLQMAREAKIVRDAEGVVLPEHDAQLARFEAGDFGRPVHALDSPKSDLPKGNPDTVGGYGRKLPAKATEKQVAFLVSLAGQLNDTARGTIIARNASGLTKREASEQIGELLEEVKSQPKAAPKPRAQETRKAAEPGLYHYNGTIVKVQSNRAHTSVYGKVLDLDTGEYNYTPGVQYKVTETLTLDKAIEIAQGAQHALNGSCALCSRELTDEYSISVGIGPICRGKL